MVGVDDLSEVIKIRFLVVRQSPSDRSVIGMADLVQYLFLGSSLGYTWSKWCGTIRPYSVSASTICQLVVFTTAGSVSKRT